MKLKNIVRTFAIFTILGFAIPIGYQAVSETSGLVSNRWGLFHLFTADRVIDAWIQVSDKSSPWVSEMTEFDDIELHYPKKYGGQQTVQALMKVFDEIYNRGHVRTTVRIFGKVDKTEIKSKVSQFTIAEIDTRYSRTEWLQLLLDKGITIENFGAYASYLSKRYTLAFLEDNPNMQKIGILGIHPTDNWEAYKAAYIEKLVNHRNQITNSMRLSKSKTAK